MVVPGNLEVTEMEGCLKMTFLFAKTYKITNFYIVNGVLATFPGKKILRKLLSGGECELFFEIVILAMWHQGESRMDGKGLCHLTLRVAADCQKP